MKNRYMVGLNFFD